ncbi:hypothetical protein P9112_007350 [Eukaryota sp. TZLM1-RC]
MISVREQQPALQLFPYTPLPAITLSSSETETGRRLLLKTFIISGAPYSLADNTHFQDLLKFYNVNAVLLSFSTVSRSIRDAYNKLCPTNLQSLSHNIYAYSLIIDLWTSRAKRPYLRITVHYVNSDKALSSLALDIKKIPYPLTAEAIAVLLKDVTNEWSNQKLVAITFDEEAEKAETADLISIATDNGANIKRQYKSLLNTVHTYITKKCMAHVLNLVVKSGLKVLNEQLLKNHNFVKKCHVSSKMYQLLLQELLEQGFKNKTIPMDTSIR